MIHHIPRPFRLPSSCYWSIIKKRYELAIFLFISQWVLASRCYCCFRRFIFFNSHLLIARMMCVWHVFITIFKRSLSGHLTDLARHKHIYPHTHHQPKTICKCVSVRCVYNVHAETRLNMPQMNLNFDTKQLQLPGHCPNCGMEHKFINRNSYLLNCNNTVPSSSSKRIRSHQIIINISINRTECLNFFLMCLFSSAQRVYLMVNFIWRQITNPIQDARTNTNKEEEVQRPLNFANRWS